MNGKVGSRVVGKWTEGTVLFRALVVGNQQLAQQLIITQLMIRSNGGPRIYRTALDVHMRSTVLYLILRL